MFLGHRTPSWKDFALVLYTHGQPGCPRPCAALSLCMAFLTWNVTRKSDVRCWATMLLLDAFLVCLLQESSTSEWSSTGAMGCLCIFVGVSSHVAKPENSRWWRGACGAFCWQPRKNPLEWSQLSRLICRSHPEGYGVKTCSHILHVFCWVSMMINIKSPVMVRSTRNFIRHSPS